MGDQPCYMGLPVLLHRVARLATREGGGWPTLLSVVGVVCYKGRRLCYMGPCALLPRVAGFATRGTTGGAGGGWCCYVQRF
jgi:hypothetical protein